jgi:DNA-binding transcriptional LysR family regulator
VFDPETSRRTFHIVGSDYAAVAIIAPLAERLFSAAPGVTLDIVPPSENPRPLLRDGAVDLVIGPETFVLTDEPFDLLFEERIVVAGWSGNPVFERPLTEQDLLEAGHVVGAFGAERTKGYADQQLETLGVKRRTEVSLGYFAALPWFLPGTSRLALMYERLAWRFAQYAPIRYAPPPLPMSPTRFVLQHHRSRLRDPGLIWLRGQILEAVAAPLQA